MITFENRFYSAEINELGDITVKDIFGRTLINHFNFKATYGVTANNTADVARGHSKVSVNADEVGQFEVGDMIEIHTGAINNSLCVVATITSIEGNTINFTPAITSMGEDAEYPNRIVQKVTHEVNGLVNVVTGETITEDGKEVTITGDTSVSSVVLKLTLLNDSAQIKVETTIEYNTDVKVFNEKLDISFNVKPTKVFKKNRQVDQLLKSRHYWLDKQGAYFGSKEQSVSIYHTPDISSLELLVPEKMLVINLDDMRDHRYRWVKQADGGARRYRDRHASEYNTYDVRINRFDLWVGQELNVCQFMLNPEGYLSTYIWTEHADRATLNSQRATVFGDQDVTAYENAVAGFAKHQIPITKSVFYDSLGLDFVSIKNHRDGAAFIEFLDQLHHKGFDICLHSGGYTTTLRPTIEEMIPFMKERYESITWIDHMADYNRTDISADAMTPPAELGKTLQDSSYAKDLWEEYSTKYFWQYSSEDNRIPAGRIDLLRPFQNDSRTPLYWKHPTVTYDFYTWATTRLSSHDQTASAWNNELSKNNLDRLVDDWGVCINHGYFAYEPNSGIIQTVEGKLKLHPLFDEALGRLADYKQNKRINITTIDKIMDYWTAIEDIEVTYSNDETLLKNNSGRAIENLSMTVMNADEILVNGVKPEYIVDRENMVFWFDIDADETVSIKVKTSQLSVPQMRRRMKYSQTVGVSMKV